VSCRERSEPCSVLRRQLRELRHGKDGAVLADVDRADVAAAALADAALHPILQRGVDLVRREAQLREHGHGELDHDRRAADDGDGVLGGGGDLLEDGRHEPHVAFPVGRLAAGVDRGVEVDVRASVPLGQFLLVDQVGDGAGAVDDGDVVVLVAQVEAIPYDAAHGRQGDAAGDEQQLPAAPLLDREHVSVGATEADEVALVAVGERRRHATHLAERALDVAPARRRRGDAEGRLALAGG
jgi:hypothetical protein